MNQLRRYALLFPEPVPHSGRQEPLYELIGVAKSGVTVQLLQLLESSATQPVEEGAHVPSD